MLDSSPLTLPTSSIDDGTWYVLSKAHIKSGIITFDCEKNLPTVLEFVGKEGDLINSLTLSFKIKGIHTLKLKDCIPLEKLCELSAIGVIVRTPHCFLLKYVDRPSRKMLQAAPLIKVGFPTRITTSFLIPPKSLFGVKIAHFGRSPLSLVVKIEHSEISIRNITAVSGIETLNLFSNSSSEEYPISITLSSGDFSMPYVGVSSCIGYRLFTTKKSNRGLR